jgi:hypothetical protein
MVRVPAPGCIFGFLRGLAFLARLGGGSGGGLLVKMDASGGGSGGGLVGVGVIGGGGALAVAGMCVFGVGTTGMVFKFLFIVSVCFFGVFFDVWGWVGVGLRFPDRPTLPQCRDCAWLGAGLALLGGAITSFPPHPLVLCYAGIRRERLRGRPPRCGRPLLRQR